jgi:hypothetical protein
LSRLTNRQEQRSACLDRQTAERAGIGGVKRRELAAVCELDDRGRVQDVVARPGKTPGKRTLACVKKALAGLTFPCLGGLKVCPEYVIIE